MKQQVVLQICALIGLLSANAIVALEEDEVLGLGLFDHVLGRITDFDLGTVELQLQNYKKILDQNAYTNANLQPERVENLKAVNELLEIGRLDLLDCETDVLENNARLLAVYSHRPYLRSYLEHHNKRLHDICLDALEDSVEVVGQRFADQRGKFQKIIECQDPNRPSNFYQRQPQPAESLQSIMAQYLLNSDTYKRIKDTKGKSKQVLVSEAFEEDFGPHCRALRDELGQLEPLFSLLEEVDPLLSQRLKPNTNFWQTNVLLCEDMLSRHIDLKKVYEIYRQSKPSALNKLKGVLLSRTQTGS